MEKQILVSYSTEEKRDKLERFIYMITNRKISLGALDYGGKLTILTLDKTLTNICKINITCANHFPGKRFKNVDEFIDWYMKYISIKIQFSDDYSFGRDVDTDIYDIIIEGNNVIRLCKIWHLQNIEMLKEYINNTYEDNISGKVKFLTALDDNHIEYRVRMWHYF